MKTKALWGVAAIEAVGLLALGWQLIDCQTGDGGREFKSQQAMCTYFAQSYLKSQGKLVGTSGERWSKAIEVESDLYDLCLTNLTDDNQPTVTSQPNPTDTMAQPTETAKMQSTAGVGKKISYNLPVGWTTAIDNNNKIEVGYDRVKYEAKTRENGVDLVGRWSEKDGKPIRLGWNRHVYFSQYSGGSRHAELYKILGVNNPVTDDWKHPDYFGERNYNVNGWNCLTIDGVSISQFPGAWSYCPISGSQALVIAQEGYGWSQIEEQLGAIRLVE